MGVGFSRDGNFCLTRRYPVQPDPNGFTLHSSAHTLDSLSHLSSHIDSISPNSSLTLSLSLSIIPCRTAALALSVSPPPVLIYSVLYFSSFILFYFIIIIIIFFFWYWCIWYCPATVSFWFSFKAFLHLYSKFSLSKLLVKWWSTRILKENNDGSKLA